VKGFGLSGVERRFVILSLFLAMPKMALIRPFRSLSPGTSRTRQCFRPARNSPGRILSRGLFSHAPGVPHVGITVIVSLLQRSDRFVDTMPLAFLPLMIPSSGVATDTFNRRHARYRQAPLTIPSFAYLQATFTYLV